MYILSGVCKCVHFELRALDESYAIEAARG